MPTTPPDAPVPASWFTRWTHLDLPAGDVLRLFGGDFSVPTEVASLQGIAAALQAEFHLGMDEVARLLGVTSIEVGQHLPPSLDVLDRLYALGGLLDLLVRTGGASAVDWMLQPLPVLGWRPPIDFCGTRCGFVYIREILEGLSDGMFA